MNRYLNIKIKKYENAYKENRIYKIIIIIIINDKFLSKHTSLKKNLYKRDYFITYQSICKVTFIIYIYTLNINNTF